MFGQNDKTYTRNGNKLYKERKFDQALPQYQKALELNSSDPVVSYNMGNTLFRTGKFDQAAKTFDAPLSEGNEVSVRQRAFYNKGVSLSKQNMPEESIEAYKNALKLNPADEDARINLQKALLEVKKKKPPEKEEKKDEKKKQDKKEQKKPPPQSKLNKKQVEQLLKALQQREQQVQQKMQQNRSRSTTQPEKDW
jgi:tetratricopeptide (TPR) repeat protein